MYSAFVEEGSRLSGWAASRASEESGFAKGGRGVFSYDTTALEVFQWATDRGLARVLGQMDPAAVEFDLVREEARLWPGWQDAAADIPDAYLRRREQEWDAATRIVVNSEFCRRALLAQGVPEDRLTVIPLTFEMRHPASGTPPARPGGPLRVLFLGQVNIRKGVPWLIEAARRLPVGVAQITIAGPVQVSDVAWRSLPANTKVLGPVPRVEAERLYRSSDVFVLPTISDGFAITQLEALAHGLPLIVTPNCGDAVRHGVDGLQVPIRDPQALADAFRRFADDRVFLAQASEAARQRALDFSLDAVSRRWMSLPEFQRGVPHQP
jgi:glycosyltransferase involved in cell wall biosynthesis